MKKVIFFLLISFCFTFLAAGAKIANAQEVNGYAVDDSMITCYSTYEACTVSAYPDCFTSVKCSTCSEKLMRQRQDKGSCDNCGCK